MQKILTNFTNYSMLKVFETLGLLLVAMMGAAVTTLMPLMVGAYSDSGHFTTQQVGWLTSADVAGILIASATAFLWGRRVNWRVVTSLGLLIFIACNIASTHITDFSHLMMIRFVAGVACGASYAISLAAFGDFKKPDQAFGAVVTTQVVFGTIGFWILPNLISVDGLDSIFEFFNLFLIPALILILITCPKNSKTSTVGAFQIDGNLKAAVYVFLGVVAYYFAQGTVWAYLERIGVDAQLTNTQIGLILGLGFAISAIGSIISGMYVDRYGRNSGLYLTALIQIPCLAVLYFMTPETAFWIYAVSTIVYQIMWSFVVPIMMALFSDIDSAGKLIVLCVSAFKVGLVIGPPVAALTINYFPVREVLWLGAISIIVSILLTVRSSNILKSTTDHV
ncbi:MFS transporter [Psychrosphaera aquimarina]|uniref:MFS transporter n=1 Tax=Psychrosphaera aquimarina TaxID=2044854 RepID=A0ABU3R0Q1_9GAMM|nr:MFS transporter [Psychrosphaera aquimarina]MDU0113239.1 MFS transporter [Psychrosphaera aquimarina]